MKGGAQITWLPDGKRMHLHHGPIDLIVEIWGAGQTVAYQRAALRFQTVLQELVDELPKLRQAADLQACFHGGIARAMQGAVEWHLPGFVTPMAAVAGAVAAELARAIAAAPNIDKADVNNGGAVALVLGPPDALVAGLGGRSARATLRGPGGVRGVRAPGGVGWGLRWRCRCFPPRSGGGHCRCNSSRGARRAGRGPVHARYGPSPDRCRRFPAGRPSRGGPWRWRSASPTGAR